ncbi:hypothetical protein BKA62DRAFT_662116 [Auriculariales sp. MPI-PUGE-AT-0066]|nr:hypothetical protein BKA62DRAFT_662116 [Auriculariales sp. MPI-PUGE-AT-0066]
MTSTDTAPPRRILLLALAALSVLNSILLLKRHARPRVDTHTNEGIDFMSFYPVAQYGDYLPLVQMKVEETVHFHPTDRVPRGAIWHAQSPRGYGYNRHGPENRLFMVTMYHEMHCLWIFTDALNGETEEHHLLHCAAYIRSGVLCGADMTLEEGDFEQRNFETQRTGATHVCRDWSMISDDLENNWRSWNQTKYSLYDDMQKHLGDDIPSPA